MFLYLVRVLLVYIHALCPYIILWLCIHNLLKNNIQFVDILSAHSFSMSRRYDVILSGLCHFKPRTQIVRVFNTPANLST